MDTAVAMEQDAEVAGGNQPEAPPPPDPPKAASGQARRRPAGKRGPIVKRRGPAEKRRGPKQKRRGQELKRQTQEQEGVTVKRVWRGGRRDKKHYCAFCRRPQIKIARHLLCKHLDEQEVLAASTMPAGSKQRHLLLEHLRCRGDYLHNIEVIRQGSGEIVSWRQPSQEVDARNYLPCTLCLGFFLRGDLWKHQVTCRKKMAIVPSEGLALLADEADAASESADPAEGTPDPPGEAADQSLASDPGADQNQNPPRRRSRVQAAASRLLPISGGASESCSEILHRMNQDSVSHQVKSDWLICKYGNKLLGGEAGGQDVSQRRYESVSQKLRELGRLLLAAKTLDSDVRSLQELLVPGQLSLALSAARKAADYRWSRPPLALKTTLKAVCDVAVAESLQDGDWEAAARTTDFSHLLERQWEQLGLQNPDPDPAERGARNKKRPGRTGTAKNLRADVLTRFGSIPGVSLVAPDSRLQNLVSGPVSPRKVQRRPWSTAEKDAVWRQLGVHVLLQTVPGKEVCQRCLDSEPVLKGRHWKDVKNQVHNQIQTQKKQQFHAETGQGENQQNQNQNQNQTEQNQQYQAQTSQPAQNRGRNQKKQQFNAQRGQGENQQNQNQNQQNQTEQNHQNPQYQVQMSQPAQDGVRNQKKQSDHQNPVYPPKKQLFQTRLDHQNTCEVQKKQLYQMDHQNQPLPTRDSPVVPAPSFNPDGPLRAHGASLMDREPSGPYPVLPRGPGVQIEPLLTRTDWAEEALVQNYQFGRLPGQNLLPDGPGGPDPLLMNRACLDRGVRF